MGGARRFVGFGKGDAQTPGMARFNGLSKATRSSAVASAIVPRTAKNVECFQSVQYTPICVSLPPIPVATNQSPIIRLR